MTSTPHLAMSALLALVLAQVAPAPAAADAPIVLAQAHDDDDPEHHDHEAEHVSEMKGLRAVHAWTRATSADDLLVFVELENTGDEAVTITGGEAEFAETVELVGFTLIDGDPTYQPMPQIPLSAGRELMLAPNGLALRLSGLDRAFADGEHFDMQIATDRGALEVEVAVEAADATQHDHAGHAH